jgi:hypothetical protein
MGTPFSGTFVVVFSEIQGGWNGGKPEAAPSTHPP